MKFLHSLSDAKKNYLVSSVGPLSFLNSFGSSKVCLCGALHGVALFGMVLNPFHISMAIFRVVMRGRSKQDDVLYSMLVLGDVMRCRVRYYSCSYFMFIFTVWNVIVMNGGVVWGEVESR